MQKIFFINLILIFTLSTFDFKVSAQDETEKVLTLDEMFHLMDENSKQLQLSKAGIEAAKSAVGVIKNSRLPSINASLSFSYLGDGTIMERDFTNAVSTPMPHFGNNISLEASQVIFSGGAISSNIAKAELQEQVAQLAYEKEELDIRFLLIGYYLDLYTLINQREVYMKNIEQTNLLISQINARQKQGMALNNDITRHELTLQNYKLALIEIENNYNIINHHLTTTLGLPHNTLIKPDTTILSTNLDIYTFPELLEIATDNSPELKSAKTNLIIAEKDVKVAKSSYLPSIALVAANNFDGPITIEVPAINKNFNYWYVGIGFKYDIASLFKSKKDVQLAKAQQSAAVTSRDMVIEQTEMTIYSDITRYNESFDKLKTLEKSLQLANENYRIINNRYMNDLVLITEMLDASNTKLSAELQVVNAKIMIIYNFYKLQRTIGKLQ